MWRLARRVTHPSRWTFAQLWVPLFAVFMLAMEFVRRLDSFSYVQFLLVAVQHLQFVELSSTCIGISPDSPKKGASVGPGHVNQRGHVQVPVDVAERGFLTRGMCACATAHMGLHCYH